MLYSQGATMERNGLFPESASMSCDAVNLAQTLYKTPVLVRHRVRCGKGRCRCQRGELHGPYAFLYWRDPSGRQRRRYVRQNEVAAIERIVCDRRSAMREARHQLVAAMADLRQIRQWLQELEQGGSL
jgi:hypothetical protein